MIAVCNREADAFEIFDAQRRHPQVAVLVRAKHDRSLGRKRLFSVMRSGAPADYLEIQVEGLTERLKSSKKKARPARRKRVANCALRFHRVTHCQQPVPSKTRNR